MIRPLSTADFRVAVGEEEEKEEKKKKRGGGGGGSCGGGGGGAGGGGGGTKIKERNHRLTASFVDVTDGSRLTEVAVICWTLSPQFCF